MTLALIHWADASYQRGECTADDLTPSVEMVSAGVLVKKTRTHFTIAMDWCPAEKCWRHIEHIPRGMVRRVEYFEGREDA